MGNAQLRMARNLWSMRVVLVVSAMLLSMSMIAEAQTLAGAKKQYKQKIPGDSAGYYDDTEYLMKRVLGAMAIGLLIAILSCVIGCCFCCVQLCAKACGDDSCCKRNCSCCGAGQAPPEGYTQKQRLILVGILFLGWMFIVVGSGLGYDGNAKVKTGIDELADTANKLSTTIYDQVKMGYDAAVIVSTADVQMVNDAAKLKKDVKEGVEKVQDNDKNRVLAVYVFYAVMMVVPVIGLLAWLFGSSKLAYIMTQITFCMLFTAWLFFGLTFAMGTILDDTCVEAGKQVYGEPNKLSELLKCGKGTAASTTYKSVWEKLDTAQSTATSQGYTVVQESAYGFTNFNDGTVDDAAVQTNANKYNRNHALLLGFYGSTYYNTQSSTCAPMTDSSATALCWVSGVTASTYNAMCSSTGSEPTSNRCLNQAQILAAVGMVGSSYMISCQHLNTIALDLNNNICEPMVSGLINVCVGQAFIGFFYFFVLAVGCMGINRFDKDNYSDNKIAPEETAGNPADMQNNKPVSSNYQVDPNSAQYSAEQAMAATRIQSAQRQKAARKKVQAKRDYRNKHT